MHLTWSLDLEHMAIAHAGYLVRAASHHQIARIRVLYVVANVDRHQPAAFMRNAVVILLGLGRWVPAMHQMLNQPSA